MTQKRLRSRDRATAYKLLEQSEANRIWAGIMKPSARNQLLGVARAMESEAISIIDELDGAPDPWTGTDEELLAALGL